VEEIEENEKGCFGGLTFLHNTKLSLFRDKKIVLEKGLGRFCMNSSNLI